LRALPHVRGEGAGRCSLVATSSLRILAVHDEGWKHNTESADDLASVFNALGVASLRDSRRG
jgi:hypothetical protein